jgi:hypothetical protein
MKCKFCGKTALPQFTITLDAPYNFKESDYCSDRCEFRDRLRHLEQCVSNHQMTVPRPTTATEVLYQQEDHRSLANTCARQEQDIFNLRKEQEQTAEQITYLQGIVAGQAGRLDAQKCKIEVADGLRAAQRDGILRRDTRIKWLETVVASQQEKIEASNTLIRCQREEIERLKKAGSQQCVVEVFGETVYGSEFVIKKLEGLRYFIRNMGL